MPQRKKRKGMNKGSKSTEKGTSRDRGTIESGGRKSDDQMEQQERM